MNWYLTALKKYAVFSGRARRKEYWYFFLFNALISVLLNVCDHLFGTYSQTAQMGVIGGIYSFVVFCPSIAVTVRRLHDIGRSAAWVAYGFLLPMALILFGALFLDTWQPAISQNPTISLIGTGLLTVLALVMVFFGIAIFIFACKRSQPGDNQYGPNPIENPTAL